MPGTTRYFDDPTAQPQQATGDNVSLKCDISGKVPIILVRRPSSPPLQTAANLVADTPALG